MRWIACMHALIILCGVGTVHVSGCRTSKHFRATDVRTGSSDTESAMPSTCDSVRGPEEAGISSVDEPGSQAATIDDGAAGKKIDEVVPVSALRPVPDPTPRTTPSRPAIMHWPTSEILPLSNEQVGRIRQIVADTYPQEDIWFILVLFNMRKPNYRVQVYCLPDHESERVRRGAGVHIHYSGKVLSPRVAPFAYAHVCETEDLCPKGLPVPDDLTKFPFRFSGSLSDDEIVQVVRFIRSAPTVPDHLRWTRGPDNVTYWHTLHTTVLDPTSPITSIHLTDAEVRVGMGLMEGPGSHWSMSYTCRRINGVWTLIRAVMSIN